MCVCVSVECVCVSVVCVCHGEGGRGSSRSGSDKAADCRESGHVVCAKQKKRTEDVACDPPRLSHPAPLNPR